MKVLKPLAIAFRTILLLGLAVAAQNVIAARTPSVKAKIDPMTVPDITVQSEDYAVARSHFHTNLLQKGPAPFQECTENHRRSHRNRICFWVFTVERGLAVPQQMTAKSPAVLFLHGGFCFDLSTWKILSLFETPVSW